MLFSKSIIGNSRVAKEQWQDVVTNRQAINNSYLALTANAGLRVNNGLIPQDVYQEFDNTTVARMRSDDGDTFLNDLLPLSKSVSIGKLIHKFRRASDAGSAQTSMSGQTGVKMDNVDYSYDGSLVPVHDAGFGRSWREWASMTSEGFDALIDDQRETVATLRRHISDVFLDGSVDADGNTIVVDGISWGGIKNDSRVAQVDLGAGGVNFDFTSTAATYEQIEAAFKQVRDVLWISNNCGADCVYYISRQIGSNMERNSSESVVTAKIIERLAGLQGVASIKVTSKLVGNEMMAFPLNGGVRPVVGMGINTVAMPRAKYNDDYNFAVWGAIGFEVRTDYSGQTCALYATG